MASTSFEDPACNTIAEHTGDDHDPRSLGPGPCLEPYTRWCQEKKTPMVYIHQQSISTPKMIELVQALGTGSATLHNFQIPGYKAIRESGKLLLLRTG